MRTRSVAPAGAAKLALAEASVIQAGDRRPGRRVRRAGAHEERSPIHAESRHPGRTQRVTAPKPGRRPPDRRELGRDFQVDPLRRPAQWVDGDPCPRCSGSSRCGTRSRWGTSSSRPQVSEALNARYLDAQEKLQTIIYGLYGMV